MGLKKLRDSKGRECYGVCCDEGVVDRLSRVADEYDLRKSLGPSVETMTVVSENDADLQKAAPTADALIAEALEALEKQRAEKPAAKPGPRFQTLRTGGESQLVWENGVPVAKAMGDNAARNPENVRKFFGPGSGGPRRSTRDGGGFVPGGLEKQEQALELLKTARANPEPFRLNPPHFGG
jgi:hypothetical protein